MANYNEFAKFYDSAVGDISKKVVFLKSLVGKHIPDAENVLEIACGTGSILKGLSKDFKEIAGLDLSPEMVKVAQQKLPTADIRVGDMIDFSFDKSFDVVLCIFDSINHLLLWEQWQAVFNKVHTHLKTGGVFIFDFNTDARLEYLASFPTQVTRLGENFMLAKVERQNDKFCFDEKVFEKKSGNVFELHQEDIYETSFPVEQIKNELIKSYDVLEIANDRNLSAEKPNWRPFLVCRKK